MLMTLMQLPDEAKLLLASLIGTGVLWLLLKLSAWLKLDLAGYAQPIAAGLTPLVVGLLEWALGWINPAYDPLVLTVIHFIVLLIGSIGTFLLLVRRKSPSLTM